MESLLQPDGEEAPAPGRCPSGPGEGLRAVVFVDDEPAVLDGLRRMLRPLRRSWRLEFAESAEAALELLERSPVDVVVSDIRMPHMDGVALLSRIRDRYPGTARVVLSGHADRKLALGAARCAHQYLQKPCDADTVRQTLERVVRLRRVLGADPVREAVGALGPLPTLPEIYDELVAALDSESSTAEEVGKIVERDPAVSAKLLQLVNSAFFGLSRPVRSPVQATRMLGLDLVREVALASALFSRFDPERVRALGLDDVWHHSVRVARVAREVVPILDLDPARAEDARLASFLHDLGRIALGAGLPDAYGEVLARAREEGIAIHQAERQVLGVTHAEVGASLVGLWGFPDSLVESIAFHHYPLARGEPAADVLAAVHLANAIAGSAPGGGSAGGASADGERVDRDLACLLALCPAADAGYVARLELGPDRIARLLELARAEGAMGADEGRGEG